MRLLRRTSRTRAQHGLRLVTNNTSELDRVKGLTLENWALNPASHGPEIITVERK